MKVRATFNIDPADANFIKANKLQIGKLVRIGLNVYKLVSGLYVKQAVA